MSVTEGTANETTQRAFADIAEEHQHIMALMDRIKGPCELDYLRLLLSELHSTLMSHFAHEQYPGGFYEYLGSRYPECHQDLRELVDDHNYILSAVRGLLERARLGDSEGTSNIGREAEELATRIREHEQREKKLSDRLVAR